MSNIINYQIALKIELSDDDRNKIRETGFYKQKYARSIADGIDSGLADACAIAAHQSSIMADDDYQSDAEGRYL